MAALVCGMSSVRHMSWYDQYFSTRSERTGAAYRVPLSGAVDRDLGTLLRASVALVLEAGR
jgi:hypothetical protein